MNFTLVVHDVVLLALVAIIARRGRKDGTDGRDGRDAPPQLPPDELADRRPPAA